MTIKSRLFKKGDKLMAYGECPRDGDECGIIYEGSVEPYQKYTCTLCGRDFRFEELNIRAADESETAAYRAEVAYQKAVDADETKAECLVMWWGFKMRTNFSANHRSGEYLE